MKYWKFWLMGRKINVITDHKPLQKNLKSRTDKELGDLANKLLQYDLGNQHSEPDCLSRNPVLECDLDEDWVILPAVNMLSLEQIKDSQKQVKINVNGKKVHNVIIRNIKRKNRILLGMEYGKKLIELIIHYKFGHVGSKHIRRHFIILIIKCLI